MQGLKEFDLTRARQLFHEGIWRVSDSEPLVALAQGGVVLSDNLVGEAQLGLCRAMLGDLPLLGAVKLNLYKIAGAHDRLLELVKRVLNLERIKRARLPPRAKCQTCCACSHTAAGSLGTDAHP